MAICIYTADSKTQAEMLVELLKNEGIKAYYVNNAGTQVFEHRFGDMSQAQSVMVNEQDAARAKQLIEAYTVQNEVELDDPRE